MQHLVLAGPADFDSWRLAAARLIGDGVSPEAVMWFAPQQSLQLVAANDHEHVAEEAERYEGSRKFIELARAVVQHRSEKRFGVLYRLAWRLREEPRLLEDLKDADVIAARAMANAVRTETQEMKSSLRFQQCGYEDDVVYIATYVPDHHIVEATAPYFARRYRHNRWSILTPRVSAHWNGRELAFGVGTGELEAARESDGEPWRNYRPVS